MANEPTNTTPPSTDAIAAAKNLLKEAAEEAENFATKVFGAEKTLEFFNNMGQNAATMLLKMTNSLLSIGSSISDLGVSFEELHNSQSNFIDMAGKQSLAAAAIVTSVVGIGNSFDGIGKNTAVVQSLSEQFTQLKSAGKLTTDALMGFGEVLKIPGIKQAGDGLGKLIENALKGADQFANLKNNYIEVMGASGGLGDAFSKSGSDLQGLNTIITRHGDYLEHVASETGNSTKAVTGYWSTLEAAIPGAANTQIRAVDEAGKSTGGLTAAMQLAAGTGQTYASVVEKMAKSVNAYGLDTEQAMAFTAQMKTVNDSLHLKMSMTEGFVNANIEAFKGLTNGGNNSINVLNGMYEAFRKTGLSAEQSVDAISNVTKSMANLNMGQKALMSAQSGGPGGIRGALQIEEQMDKGDVEGVLEKAKIFNEPFWRKVSFKKASDRGRWTSRVSIYGSATTSN